MCKKLIFIAIALFAMGACKKSFDPGATKVVKVANEWWVQYYVGGVAQNPKFTKLSTYNVAANNDSIWVDDFGNFWDFKVRAMADLTNLTFAVANAQNVSYDSKVTITEGKIMAKAAKSATGVVTDSIYFKVVFNDDPVPGTVYEVKGSARTGWAEDDY